MDEPQVNFTYFCPACGSPSVEVPMLDGGTASCGACPWTGSRQELAAVPSGMDGLTQEEAIRRFVSAFSNVIVKSSGVELGRLLMHWGFADPDKLKSDLASYLKAIAVAACRAVLETRQHLERARVNARRNSYVS